MARAIERHEAGQIVIVPIILEPCDWLSSPLRQFKALPGDGKPVSEWTNQNAALLDVVSELRRLVRAMSPSGATPPAADQPAPRQPPVTSRYRIKKTFDRIDRDDFRATTYETIRKYFEESAKELDGVDDLRARYQTIGPTAFTCTVVNRLIKSGSRGEAHITVHVSPRAVLGDIYYSFAPSAAENTANGSFAIECDDYHPFLRPSSFSSAQDNRKWYPQEVAARLWQEFLQQAGISYDL
jgi:hypothetical protein